MVIDGGGKIDVVSLDVSKDIGIIDGEGGGVSNGVDERNEVVEDAFFS